MRSGKIITLSVWLMILFNLLLSFGAVWSFQRMNPEIQNIYERNIVSLNACEQMLLALTEENVDQKKFQDALNTASNNITEEGEEKVVHEIRSLFNDFLKKPELKKELSQKIIELNNYNKQAIITSAQKTQRLRQAGAWGIVLMTITFFIVAIFFEQKLRRALLDPLQEIDSVLEARKQGDKFRRCQLPNASSDMKKLLQEINSLLDR